MTLIVTISRRHYLIQQLEDLGLRAEVPRDIDLHPSVGQPRRVDDSELRDCGVRARLAPTDHLTSRLLRMLQTRDGMERWACGCYPAEEGEEGLSAVPRAR